MARRLLQIVPTLLVISAVLFFGMRAVPGGPLAAFASTPGLSEAARASMVHQWGLDKPLVTQYLLWLKSMFSGDWQYSFFLNKPVSAAIAETLPATLLLTGTAFLLQQLIAIPAGIFSAVRRYSKGEQVVTFVSYVLFAMPVFWLGLMMILFFAVHLQWFPTGGIEDVRVTGAAWGTPEFYDWLWSHPWQGFLELTWHLFLPALTIALVGVAADVRFLRDSLLEALGQDYVRTARAKGMPESVAVGRHALRNALLPVVTNLSLALPGLFTGAVVVEVIFDWPGMGNLFFQALAASDYALMMGIMFVTSCLVVFFNLLADLSYTLIDPRVSYD